jgi:hypothetical protein
MVFCGSAGESVVLHDCNPKVPKKMIEIKRVKYVLIANCVKFVLVIPIMIPNIQHYANGLTNNCLKLFIIKIIPVLGKLI